ncbi:MAG TPA: 50S ribosomal protein L4 [candidate division WWE3 bacterium]|uniref:Large ribosomal subunit protein uL4 n=1 Tax=candidate division WWE3 bacterium TaxID=2053526 RepID=A0A7V5J048_UNCKA|nr:50S ribosomal protein L4 [candidate division WWE3 bacterium]
MKMKVVFFDKNLKKSSKDLPKNFVVSKLVPDLVSQYVYIYLFNQRQGTSSTKTRAEVRGGGKKPWRQKGTGRARHGSIRSPIWVGGGVSHGPKPYKKRLKMPKKMKSLVFRMVLTKKAQDNNVLVVDFANLKKTKDSQKILSKVLGDVLGKKRVLVVHENEEAIYKNVKNIPKVEPISLSELNSFHLLKAYNIIFTPKSLEELSKRYK